MPYKYTIEQLMTDEYPEKISLNNTLLDDDATKKVLQFCMNNPKYFHQLFGFLIIMWTGGLIKTVEGERKYIDTLLFPEEKAPQ